MTTNSLLLSPAELQQFLAKAFKEVRLTKNHTQKAASEYTGVPLATLKKFEGTGKISLRQFLLLCHVYGDLSATEKLFPKKEVDSMDELLRSETSTRKRQRGRL